MTVFAQSPGLLVSVRTAKEAEAAFSGGAEVIDIKEPARGPMGRADADVIDAVTRVVAGRRLVSAAFGELVDCDGVVPSGASPGGVGYLKWGLARCAGGDAWRAFFSRQWSDGSRRAVAVAYADWQRAGSPPVRDVILFAVAHPGAVVLVDTFGKEPTVRGRRPTLLDWLDTEEAVDLCQCCREAGVRIALAGSLGLKEIRDLAPARPDWFGVRGAVCAGGNRHETVELARVQALVNALGESLTAARRAS